MMQPAATGSTDIPLHRFPWLHVCLSPDISAAGKTSFHVSLCLCIIFILTVGTWVMISRQFHRIWLNSAVNLHKHLLSYNYCFLSPRETLSRWQISKCTHPILMMFVSNSLIISLTSEPQQKCGISFSSSILSFCWTLFLSCFFFYDFFSVFVKSVILIIHQSDLWLKVPGCPLWGRLRNVFDIFYPWTIFFTVCCTKLMVGATIIDF